MKVKVKLLSRVWLFVTPWTVAHQSPPSMEFSRQKCWSGLPFPSPGDLPDRGVKPSVSHCRQTLLPSEPPGKSISSVQSLSPDFATPWITARQASLSITNPRSLLKLMPIEVYSGSQFWHIRIHWNTIYLKIQILKLYSRSTEWESWGGILMLLRSLWSGKLEITDFYRSSTSTGKWIPGSHSTYRYDIDWAEFNFPDRSRESYP